MGVSISKKLGSIVLNQKRALQAPGQVLGVVLLSIDLPTLTANALEQ